MPRSSRSRRGDATNPQSLSEIQPFPRWAKGGAGAPTIQATQQFFAGAALARLDQILRSGADVSSAGGRAADVSSAGKNFGEGGAEPVFAGALASASRLARRRRLRRDGAAARRRSGRYATPSISPALTRRRRRADACIGSGVSSRRVQRDIDARFIRVAADCLELPPHIDCEALAALVQEAFDARKSA